MNKTSNSCERKNKELTRYMYFSLFVSLLYFKMGLDGKKTSPLEVKKKLQIKIFTGILNDRSLIKKYMT
jgi:hypothetical protein